MQRNGYLKLKCLCLSFLYLTACSTQLAPENLKAEYSLAPAQSALWNQLESIRSDDWFYPLNQGDTALDWRLRAIDSASSSIELQSFIWQFDTVGNTILKHILAAAERGVRIRILIDDSFLLTSDSTVFALDSHPGIEYRVYNPYKRRSTQMVSRQILNLGDFKRLDHRMHNKVMIVDGRVAILGGRNLSNEYFGFSDAGNFRDMELLTGGPIVNELNDGFDQYWNNPWVFPASDIINLQGNAPPFEIKIDPTNPILARIHQEENQAQRTKQWQDLIEQAAAGRPELIIDVPAEKSPSNKAEAPVQVSNRLLDFINSAEKDIWMVSAYMIPTPEFELAIEQALKRGVRVHILTNSIRSNNHLTAHSAYEKHIRQLLEIGVDLHEVRTDAISRKFYIEEPLGGKTLALHAKLMLVDEDKVFVGSANFDPRSLKINTEMGLIIQSRELNQNLLEAIKIDFLPVNAWYVQLTDAQKITWQSDTQTLNKQPANSFMQRIEDWFFAHLPIENEM